MIGVLIKLLGGWVLGLSAYGAECLVVLVCLILDGLLFGLLPEGLVT